MGVPSFELMLVAGRAVFLVFSFTLAAVAFTAWRRTTLAAADRSRADHETILQKLAALEASLEATHAVVTQLGEAIEQPRHVAGTLSSASPGYQIAIRLAKSGASREELISKCGLSIHEAELAHRLHAPRSPSRQAVPA